MLSSCRISTHHTISRPTRRLLFIQSPEVQGHPSDFETPAQHAALSRPEDEKLELLAIIGIPGINFTWFPQKVSDYRSQAQSLVMFNVLIIMPFITHNIDIDPLQDRAFFVLVSTMTDQAPM